MEELLNVALVVHPNIPEENNDIKSAFELIEMIEQIQVSFATKSRRSN